MENIFLNGRFLSRNPTGVDRVASELFNALQQRYERNGTPLMKGLRPNTPIALPQERPNTVLSAMNVLPSPWGGQLWEQVSLARARPNDWLLSLCNMGPVLRKRQIVMIHDAQAFRQPESYSRAFRAWYDFAQPKLGRRARAVLTVSQHAKREIAHFGIAPADKIKVIYNGGDHILRITPDVETLQRHGLKRKQYFLAIGSLAPHKNLQRLVEASRSRTNRSIPLVIAGGGNSAIFGDAGITASEDVRILGRVSDGELRALYQHATALTFPSLTEGFGLPPAEAMFCGCPVIASTGGAIPEVCGDAAIMIDPLDIRAWARAMEKLAGSPETQDKMAQTGKKHIAYYSWQRAAEELDDHLRLITHDQVTA